MSKQKLREYGINAKMALEVCVHISARSLDEAVDKAKTMELDQFVDILGDYNDGNFKVSGVFELDSVTEA